MLQRLAAAAVLPDRGNCLAAGVAVLLTAPAGSSRWQHAMHRHAVAAGVRSLPVCFGLEAVTLQFVM